MASVNLFTAERMQTIEDTTVVSGLVDVNGDLILYQRDGTPVNAGLVKGEPGVPGVNGTNGIDGVDGVDGVDSISTYYPLGSIVPWTGPVLPAWGLELAGQTIINGAVTYSALAAINPSWVSGSNLVLPDWRGKVPAGKAASGTFGTLGAAVGAETTSIPNHAHSHVSPNGMNSGHVRGISGGDTGYFGTHGSIVFAGIVTGQQANVAGGTISGGVEKYVITSTQAGAATPSIVQPTVVVRWIVCAASSEGEFDTMVQAALVANVNQVLSVSGSNLSVFQAKMSSNFTKSGASSWVTVPFTLQELDLNNDYDAPNSKFIAPVNGVYEFSASLLTSTLNGGPLAGFSLNGAAPGFEIGGYAEQYSSSSATKIVQMNAGDTMEIKVNNANGVSLTLAAAYGNLFCGKIIAVL